MYSSSWFFLDKQQAGFENPPLYKVVTDQRSLGTDALEKDGACYSFEIPVESKISEGSLSFFCF